MIDQCRAEIRSSPAGEELVQTVQVLLVDDYPDFLDAVARFLSTIPHVEIVGRARSGREALNQVARVRPDLVLMDLAMPDMSGLEATRHIKAQADAPLVVILTFHNAPAYCRAAQAVGADSVIGKADFGDEFVSLIHGLFPRLLDH